MSNQPNRRWPHRLLLLLGIGFLLLLAALAISAVRLRFLAQALLASTSVIHSTADAEHMIAIWRNRQDSHFSDEQALPDGDHSYTFQVENAPLHQLRIVTDAGFHEHYHAQWRIAEHHVSHVYREGA